MKESFINFINNLQSHLCQELENLDGKAGFASQKWERAGGGGGNTRIISNGAVFEKGGVNTSVVFGKVTEPMQQQFQVSADNWFACGISSVLHPLNPMVPTIHFNYRLFECYDADGALVDRWFGGGTDLTPYYLYDEDAKHFHSVFKQTVDSFEGNHYASFKKHCDEYFVNKHRNNECRGIGGIFYDHQRPKNDEEATFWLDFAKACGYAFTKAYLPIVQKRKDLPFTEAQKYWQEIRRGRYVEFNLIHDRGTLFGLRTNGRTESILMSLPPRARFDYSDKPEPGTAEARLLEVCLNPVDWADLQEADELEWARKANTC